MESAPETALNVTNSSGFSISYNSDNEILKEKRDLEVKNSKSSSSSSSSNSSSSSIQSDDGGSENGGFVSGGDDDFVEAPERLFEEDLDEDSEAKAAERADANGNRNVNYNSDISLPNMGIQVEEVPVVDSLGIVGVPRINELEGEKVVDPLMKEGSFAGGDKGLQIVLEGFGDKVETGKRELEDEVVLENTYFPIGDLLKDGIPKEGAAQVLLQDEGEEELGNPKSNEVVSVAVEEGYAPEKLNTTATELKEEDAVKDKKEKSTDCDLR